LQDEVREPRNYLAILQAIGGGAHSLSEIANASMISTIHLSSYLAQLQDLRLVERRLPATVPTARRHRSRMGRYHLSEPFLRFHFRFLEPYAQEGILSYQPERVLPTIQRDLRAFVGSTAWEELARQWTLAQRATDVLGFTPEVIGSHWSRSVQIDLVAINWQTHDRFWLFPRGGPQLASFADVSCSGG
jgi:AAA+ ATPase superfamily predicted ATPase